MEITLINRRKDSETREEIDGLLNSFTDKESKKFWLNTLVKQGRLSDLRAGQITLEHNLI